MKTQVNLKKLIKVFDEHNEIYKGHTTSIIGLIGEDLNAAIFADYLVRRKKLKNVEVLPYRVKIEQKHVRGRELDRWIKADNTLYQTEIKNWCCFKIAGYKLLLKAKTEDVRELTKNLWKRELKDQYKDKNSIKNLTGVSKVLIKMKIPDEIKGYKKAEPLVIHWMPISNNSADPLFSLKIQNLRMGKRLTKQIRENFKKINYFSCSLYVRELVNKSQTKLDPKLDLDLPNIKARMNIIKQLINLT